jgi:predicted alpha/beta hydrolase
MEQRRIAAADGFALGSTVFESPSPKRVVVLAAATAVPQRFYRHFAQWLTTSGSTVVTFDYRGIGASRPRSLRQWSAQMRDWGQLDLEGVFTAARAWWPSLPLHFVGHSVGGQLLGFAPSNHLITRAVTVGSQSGYWGHWAGAERLVMWALWHGVFPSVARVVGHFPGWLGVGEDLPRGVAQEWARWGRHPDFFLGDGISREGFARVTADLLSLSFADDVYARMPAVAWLHRLFTGATVYRRHLAPGELGVKRIGHFGAFRPQFAASLWATIERFLAAPVVVPSTVALGAVA